MHFMPDTEDADSIAERFWPEGHKKVIREDMHELIGAQLNGGKKLRHIYQQQYSEKYTDLNQFTDKIAGMVAIGAENGADNAFDEIITAFLTESPLPEIPRYAHYLWPKALSPKVNQRLRQVIIDEYSQDEIYSYAYKVGYQNSYHSFGDFINQVAQLVLNGTTNSADDMLEVIYKSFATHSPLPPARRHPRRLKNW